MNFNVLNSLILAGVIQGVIFGAIYLLSNKTRARSNFYLVALMLTFSYNNLQFFLINSGVFEGRRMYETIYIPVGSLIPVFIYFYVLVFLYPARKISRKLKLLYLPFLVFFFFLAIPCKIGALVHENDPNYFTYRYFNGFQSIFSLIYTVVLILISYFTVLRAEKRSKGVEPNYRWLKITLLVLFFLACFWSLALIKYLSNSEYQFYFNLLWLGLSICIYWLGHFGIYKYGIQKERKKIRDYRKENIVEVVSEKSKNEHIKKLEKLVFEERRFLESNLSLESLATELQLSRGHLSRIINTELGTSFSEYLNERRVEEAKKHLLNPEFSNYTLVSIGLESGFNSKTTFNTTFKKHTGLTPSQFKKNNAN